MFANQFGFGCCAGTGDTGTGCHCARTDPGAPTIEVPSSINMTQVNFVDYDSYCNPIEMETKLTVGMTYQVGSFQYVNEFNGGFHGPFTFTGGYWASEPYIFPSMHYFECSGFCAYYRVNIITCGFGEFVKAFTSSSDYPDLPDPNASNPDCVTLIADEMYYQNGSVTSGCGTWTGVTGSGQRVDYIPVGSHYIAGYGPPAFYWWPS